MVIHAVDTAARTAFSPQRVELLPRQDFLVTYHEARSGACKWTEDRAVKVAGGIARAPDRVAYNLLDAIVDNYKPALDELSLEIAELEQLVMREPTKETLNKILQIKKEVLHLRDHRSATRSAGPLRPRRIQAHPRSLGTVLSGRA